MTRSLGIVLVLSGVLIGSTKATATGEERPPRPKVAFSTFLGGAHVDGISDMEVDGAGNIYVVGATTSPDLPTVNAVQESYAGGSCEFDQPCTDGFIAKLTSDGRTVVYMTYLGGTEHDYANAVAVDGSGNAYVTGGSVSRDFPTTAGGFQTRTGSGPDVFVTKLGPSGSLVYSTLFGGDAGWGDIGFAIAVDPEGNAVVTGRAHSASYPTTPGAFKTKCAEEATFYSYCLGLADAFVTKLNASGTGLIFSTFLGGDEFDEWGYALVLDGDGNVFVGGETTSDDFPTTPGSFDSTPYSAHAEGFVTKLESTGSRLVYSTTIGGASEDTILGIDIDEGGAAYVVGRTESTDFPTTASSFASKCGPGNIRRDRCEHTDGFVTKIHPDGSSVAYSAYLGGFAYDEAHDVAVDRRGRAWVVGGTSAPEFPVIRPVQSKLRGRACESQDCFDLFVARVDRSGDSLDMSTFYGGHSHEVGTAVALGGKQRAYVAGRTHSPGFPVADALKPKMQSRKGCRERHPYYVEYRCADGFVLKIRDVADPDTHPRRVTLELRRHLVVRGRITVSTRDAGCARNVPVTVFTGGDGKTERVARARTNGKGRYRTRVEHREAAYFARVPQVAKPGGDVCQRAISRWEVHQHSS